MLLVVFSLAILGPMYDRIETLSGGVGATMLLSYPRKLPAVALLASAFSTVKWTAIAAESVWSSSVWWPG